MTSDQLRVVICHIDRIAISRSLTASARADRQKQQEKLNLKRSQLQRYSIAILSTVVAMLLTEWLWWQLQPTIYPFFLSAVAMSGWMQCYALSNGKLNAIAHFCSNRKLELKHDTGYAIANLIR
ncbi:hypothetical protein [Scytonema millei]|uniref:Uncharacterized protein n=1 Tax=Scytonema millei VB511283 TaxID=1245923 RepID=A0A9X5E8X6_9CYAN|nr:hypothetical protein [Scytonema millei]NHC37359.1 hypothetical protein [Scytonema millei VB511283]